MSGLVEINLEFSLPGVSDPVVRVRLRYDPESSYTWIPPRVMETLTSDFRITPGRRRRRASGSTGVLSVFQTRTVREPGTDKCRSVQTVLVQLQHNVMVAVDEVIVADRDEEARLGWRSLVALNAFVDETLDGGTGCIGSGDVLFRKKSQEVKIARLTPKSSTEPYSLLYRRAKSLGLVESLDELHSPFKRNSLSRASLVLRFLQERLFDGRPITFKRLASELNFALTRLLNLTEAATLTCGRGQSGWSEMPASGLLRSVHNSIPPPHKCNGGSMTISEQCLCWFFPLQPAAKRLEHRLACLVRPTTPEDKYFLVRLFHVLGPVIDLLLLQCDSTEDLIESRRHAKLLLGFPRSKEDQVSYDLLDHAKLACPGWSYMSFWRTSRTAQQLEKTAEHFPNDQFPNKRRQMNRVRLVWKDVDVNPSRSQRSFESESRGYQLLVVPMSGGTMVAREPVGAVPSDVAEAGDEILLKGVPMRRRRKTDQIKRRRIVLRQIAGCPPAPAEVCISMEDYDKFDSRARKPAFVNLNRLLTQLPLREGEAVLVLGACLRAPGPETRSEPQSDSGKSECDRHLRASHQFHLLLTVVVPREHLAAVRHGALATLRRALELRLLQYSVLSWSRFQLRCVGDFLAQLFTATDKQTLGQQLSRTLQSQMGTDSFLILSELAEQPILSSADLKEWSHRLTIPKLHEDHRASDCRNLAEYLGDEYVQLVADYKAIYKIEDKELPGSDRKPKREPIKREVGGIFAQISETMVLLVIKDGWGGWKISSLEYSATRVLAAALRLARPLAEFQPVALPRRIEWSDDMKSLLCTRKTTDLSEPLERLMDSMLERLSGVSKVFSIGRTTMFAVDAEAKFVKVIAETRRPEVSVDSDAVAMEDKPLKGVVSKNSPSMVTVSLEEYRQNKKKEFVPMFGLVQGPGSVELAPGEIHDGQWIELLDDNLVPTGRKVRFLGLLQANSGDLLHVQGFGRINREPLGFLAVRLGIRAEVDALLLREAKSIVQRFAEEAALVLQRQIELRAVGVRRTYTEALRVLQEEVQNVPITDYRELLGEMAEYDNSAAGLPPPLLRAFSPKFCDRLRKTLSAMAKAVQATSAGVRVAYASEHGNQCLWSLASAGRYASDERLRFDDPQQLECFVCRSANLRSEEEADMGRLFVPDYRQPDKLATIYDGAPAPSDTTNALQSALFFSFCVKTFDGERAAPKAVSGPHRLLFYVSSGDFIELWLLEDVLKRVASDVASEVILHYRRVEDIERAALDFASSTIRSIQHTLDREVLTPFSDVRHSERAVARLKLEAEIAEKLAGRPQKQPLSECLDLCDDRLRLYCGPPPPVLITCCNGGDAPPKVPVSLQLILIKLLVEQTHTFRQYGKFGPESDSTVKFALGWRRVDDGQTVVIDVFSNQRIDNEQTRLLLPYLFWYRLGDNTRLPRPAAGRTGSGLYYIGKMLRSLGIRPTIKAVVSESCRNAYRGRSPAFDFGELTGFPIELNLPPG